MKNPWPSLPKKPPYVLEIDAPFVNEQGARWHASGGAKELNLSVHPIPFQGNPEKARVILLMLNPGTTERYTEPSGLIEQRRLNYVFKSHPAFVSMDPRFADVTNRYWLNRLGSLTEAVGLQTVQEYVSVIQYFPYWSKDGKAVFDGLPSQQFSRELVQHALDAGKLVVVMRSAGKWARAIPQLAKAKTITNRNRSPYVSPGNLGASEFNRVVATLRG
jgi:hypothetical protein